MMRTASRSRTALGWVVLAGLALAGAQVQAASVAGPASHVIPRGQAADVPISISDAPSSAGIVGVDIWLRYEGSIAVPSVVVTAGTATEGWTVVTNIVENVSGTTDEMRISAASTAPLNVPTSGTLLMVRFTAANQGTPGSTPLTFQVAELNEQAVSAAAGLIKIGGTSGTATTGPASITPGQSVMLTVTDADLGNSGTVSVAVRSKRGAGTLETQPVVLTATGTGNVFQGTATTVYGATANDLTSVFEVQTGDSLRVEYADVLDALGSGATVISSPATLVTGGTSGTSVTPSAASITPGQSLSFSVVDGDLASPGTTTVTVYSKHGNTVLESKTITLTSAISGAPFTGSVTTLFGATVDGGTAAFEVQAGDTIKVDYVDALDPQGGTTTFTAFTLVLGGSAGTSVTPSATSITPGQSLSFSVVDGDLASPGTTTVTVYSKHGNTVLESKTITLTSAIGGAPFTGSVTTLFGATVDGGTAAFEVQAGDTIKVDYVDALDPQGGSTTLTSLTRVIGGTNGTVTTAPASIKPGQPVTVTVTDADLGNTGSVAVTVRSHRGAVLLESKSVSLPAIGSGNVFQGTVSTVFGTAASAGTLAFEVKKGDSLNAEYTDQLTTTGGTATAISSPATRVIGGVRGTLKVSRGVQAGDGLRVELADGDLNQNDAAQEQTTVTVTDPTTGDVETVTLSETGNATGIFRVAPPFPTADSGIPHDGKLKVARQENIETSYTDLLNDDGGPTTVMAYTRGVMWGDTSKNDKVGSLDASLILKHTVANPAFPAGSYEELVGDVNPLGGNDPHVTADDATHVLQYTVGIITVFPIQSGIPHPHPYKPVAAERTVSLGQPVADGNDLQVPLQVGDAEGILSGQVVLAYDPHQYRVAGVTAAATLQDFLLASNAVDGRLRIAFAGARPAGSGSGSVLSIRVERVGAGAANGLLSLQEVLLNDGQIPVRMTESVPVVPRSYGLIQNWPNPFNPETSLGYALPEPGQVRLAVYDLLGQKVRTLVDGYQAAGLHSARWDGRDDEGRALASGTYLYRMEAGTFAQTRKMVLLR